MIPAPEGTRFLQHHAAADGIVVDAHDGEPDMITTPKGQLSNYVVIDHGYAHETWYFHLKMGSVAVAIGDVEQWFSILQR